MFCFCSHKILGGGLHPSLPADLSNRMLKMRTSPFIPCLLLMSCLTSLISQTRKQKKKKKSIMTKIINHAIKWQAVHSSHINSQHGNTGKFNVWLPWLNFVKRKIVLPFFFLSTASCNTEVLVINPDLMQSFPALLQFSYTCTTHGHNFWWW